MSERALAESVRFELSEKGRKRILVRNMHNAEKFTSVLSSVLDDVRIFIVDCLDDNSLQKSLIKYFVGDSFPSKETAFEAGWRSHATEISLCSEAAGLEIVAGLQSVKVDVRNFLLNGISFPQSESVLARIYSSFAWSLPTVICFVNYTGRSAGPFAALQASTLSPIPSVVVFRKDSGDLAGSDSIIESGMMSPDSIRHYLAEENSQAAPDKVMVATGGDEGLVKLYAGLQKLTGKDGDDLYLMFDSFLQKNPQLARFAQVAALFGMQFLPGEVALLSGVGSKTVFAMGRMINLWQGHLVGYFSSGSIHQRFLKYKLPEEKDEMLRRAAEVALEFRGENSRSYQIAGDLQARAGLNLLASQSYEKAADLAEGDLRKADLYKRAALFSESKADYYLFQAALNLYRGELYPETIGVLRSIKDSSDPAFGILWGLCASFVDESLHEVFDFPGETDTPELVSGILESRDLHRDGFFHRAERILLNCAIGDPLSSVACLVELGRQLYKRGMVESSFNTMTVARREAALLGADWLERQALFTSQKAWNSLGREDKVGLELSRLIELTLLSGNRRKLVSVYNLYANSQLLCHRYSKALNIYSSALRTLATVSEPQSVRIIILNNIGVAERKLFRTGESLRTLMRQVRISVSSGNLSKACIAYGNMARIFIHLCRTDAAEDCLETMIEFASLGKIADATESICYISSQLAFMRGDSETAFSLINRSIQLSMESGKKRRLSLGLMKKGSMLLRQNRYGDAVDTLTEAMDVSRSAGTNLNLYLSEMKLTAAKCFLGQCMPVELLSIEYRGNPDYAQKGEQMYYHWLLTGSRQSMTAAAQLISRGLSHGLYFHSYLHMLQKIEQDIPISLADAIPLLHNYPSCD
ncbi:MAG: hypothetical protein KAR40_09270 [Candidatus Sabulitectum sp.]|nr:hypothetical protein [Candidatus Sabulitectum sp.]